MKIKIKKLYPQSIVPEYQSTQAAGFDLHSLEEVQINPGETKLLKTGIALELHKGTFGMIAPRSSLCLKKHLDVPNSVGIIDADYRGEILVGFRNIGDETIIIDKNERIAQVIILKHETAEFEVADELSETKRGTGGFGSTGK